MSSHDLYEDGFPHGTPEGYDRGCRGGACPAGIEFGLSCRTAWEKSHGDYQYQKLARAGSTPAQIAAALHTAPVHHEPPVRKVLVPDDADPELQDVVDDVEETPVPVAPSAPEPIPEEEPIMSTTIIDDPEVRARIRTWAAEHGIIIGAKGRLPQAVVDAFTTGNPAAAGKYWQPGKPKKPAKPAPVAPELTEDRVDEIAVDTVVDALEEHGLLEAAAEVREIEREIGDAMVAAIVHSPFVPDVETRAELFNDRWDEAERTSAIVAVDQLSASLEIALRQWAAASDRAAAAETALRHAQDALRARPRWWQRKVL